MSNKTAYEKLHRATREGNKNLVTAVLATEEGRRNIDAVNYRGVSALMLAIQRGYREIAELILNSGAHICSNTLKFAIKHGSDSDLELLLARLSNVEVQCCGKSALAHAVSVDKHSSADILINAGATSDEDLLAEAAFNNNMDMVRLLVDGDISPKTTCALTHATRARNIDLVNLLLGHKAIQNDQLNEALILAVSIGEVAIAERLLQFGANANAPVVKYRWHSESLLLQATDAGNADMVRLLLNYNADPKLFGGDAFIQASKMPDSTIFTMLLNAGTSYRDLIPNISNAAWAALEGRILRTGHSVNEATATTPTRRRI